MIFGNLRTVSYDLRKSSEGFARSSAVFKIDRLASGSLRLTSDIFVVICTRVTLFCTVLTKNALLFSQSEPSKFFKCIIN